MPEPPPLRHARTPTLSIAYEAHGPEDGAPVVLLHGFPYSPRGYDAMAATLAARGHHVVVPYLRGYGATRFLAADTPRSGEQAALGADLRDLLDALRIPRGALVGYDWGGRAACIVAALWPERVTALVTGAGYNIQNIAASVAPADAETEYRFWYQYYFQSARGLAGLHANRRGIARLLWRLWSPTWPFDAETFADSAEAFDNPDFPEIVAHSYRHRYGYAQGDPAVAGIEQALAAQPVISVPTISLHGADDGVDPPDAADESGRKFTGRYERRILKGTGHNIPQEAPAATVAALLDLLHH